MSSSPSYPLLRVYVRIGRVSPLSGPARIVAGLVGAAALAVLIVAATLEPAAGGMGTHKALGLPPCGFLENTGLPCLSCGMTTAFALVVRGRFVEAAVAQPMGMMLAIALAAVVAPAAYVAVTGSPLHRLIRTDRPGRWIVGLGLALIAAWAWKIALVVLSR